MTGTPPPGASAWTAEELTRIGEATEIQLASPRPDGTQAPVTTMWIARVADGLYVRSAGGPDRPWYRRARAAGRGHLHAAGTDYEVVFAEADPNIHDAIDAALHAKYDRYGPGPVGHITGPATHPHTLRLLRSTP